MADSPDAERTMSPLELYEKLTSQGDQVRALKTTKADKVGTNELSEIHPDYLFCGNLCLFVEITFCISLTAFIFFQLKLWQEIS